ncbi:hypothetical protein ASC58_16130 [Phycicoccus sp. Root101]|nr:hypothetical protein ASC58_16130 [Phycicoccus sp. Root101]
MSRLTSTGTLLGGAISVALLGTALLLSTVCLVLPKMLGAVPLTILSGSMAPMMPPGALAVVRPLDATRARVGDVLSYQPEPDDPTLVTHRVVAVSKDAHGVVSLALQGDANSAPDPRPVSPEQVKGSVVYAVPYVGWVATRLNVGAGAKFTRWAAYALIGVGSLRILLGLSGLTPSGGGLKVGAGRRSSRHPPLMLTWAPSPVPAAPGPAPPLSRTSRVVAPERPPTLVRDRGPVMGGLGKDDPRQDSRRWGNTCAARDSTTHGGGTPLRKQRQAMTVGGVAARLEQHLALSEPTRKVVHDECELAIRHGLSSVIVPPEMVPQVGPRLTGTSVGLVTLLGWRNGEVEPLAASALRAEACRLVAEGATDVGVLANVERLAADRGRQFAVEVTALVEVMQARGARVRVVLDTDGQSPAATTEACELLGATGAWLVQGGSWLGSRTGLSRLQLMRAALPDEVRLKWTCPIRTLDSMMIGIAEGVDLYNGDPKSLLEDAARRVSVRPLLVPVRGVDY